MTSSFTNLVLAARSLADPGSAPEERGKTGGRGRDLLTEHAGDIAALARRAYPRVVYLGSGGRLGSAHESALKMLESNGGPRRARSPTRSSVCATDRWRRSARKPRRRVSLVRPGRPRLRAGRPRRAPAQGARPMAPRRRREDPAGARPEPEDVRLDESGGERPLDDGELACSTPWPVSCSRFSAVSTGRPARFALLGGHPARRRELRHPCRRIAGRKRVLVVGEINVDLVCQGYHAFPSPGREVLVDDFQMVLGSASAICAMGLARLGTPVVFFGKVGDDPTGRFCLDAMRARNIDLDSVIVDPRLKTGVTVAITSPRRSRPRVVSRIDRGDDREGRSARALPEGRPRSRLFLLPPGGAAPGVATLLREARAAGLTTSLDPGFDPSEHWEPDLLETLPPRGRLLSQRSRARRPDPARATRGRPAVDPLEPHARRGEARRPGSDGDRRRGRAPPRSRPADRGGGHDGRRGLVRRGIPPRLARRRGPGGLPAAGRRLRSPLDAGPRGHGDAGRSRRSPGAAGGAGSEDRGVRPGPVPRRFHRPADRRHPAPTPPAAAGRRTETEHGPEDLPAGDCFSPGQTESRLVVPRTRIERFLVPVVDVHSHAVRGDARAGRRLGRADGPDRRPGVADPDRGNRREVPRALGPLRRGPSGPLRDGGRDGEGRRGGPRLSGTPAPRRSAPTSRRERSPWEN